MKAGSYLLMDLLEPLLVLVFACPGPAWELETVPGYASQILPTWG